MPVLTNQRHELFCQAVATNCTPTEAYVKAGFSPNGAAASAGKLLKSSQICTRVDELRKAVERVWVAGEIRDRNYRVALLQEMVEEMRPEPGEKRQPAQVRETRECLKQAAIEVGDWEEKRDVTVRPGVSREEYRDVPTEVLLQAKEKMLEARRLLTIEAAPGSVEEVKEPEDSGSEVEGTI